MKSTKLTFILGVLFVIGCNRAEIEPKFEIEEPVTTVRNVPEIQETTLNEVIVTAPSLVHVEGVYYNYYVPFFSNNGGMEGGSGSSGGGPSGELPSQKIFNALQKYKCNSNSFSKWGNSVQFVIAKLGADIGGRTITDLNGITTVVISPDAAKDATILNLVIQHELLHVYHQREQLSLYRSDPAKHKLISEFIAYSWGVKRLQSLNMDYAKWQVAAQDNDLNFAIQYGIDIRTAILQYGFKDPIKGQVPCF